MAEVVYLHIGAPKTGSTYLQGILARNRQSLRKTGVLAPSGAFFASLDLRGARFKGYDDPKVPGAWQRLVEQVHAWPGKVVISHENFGASLPEQIKQIVDGLGDPELHVVYTARDLVRQVPAVWQEGLKNAGVRSFEDWMTLLRTTRELGPATEPGFWWSQDAAQVVDRWGRHVDPRHLHIITVPPPGAPPTLLWERFAGLTGLRPDAYDTATARMNTSLGAVEAALLRRINGAWGEDLPWPVYQRVVKGQLAHRVLTERGAARKIVLEGQDLKWVRSCAEEIVGQLRGGQYDVVGDLDELMPSPGSDEPGRPVDDATTEEQLDAAVDAIRGLVLQVNELMAYPGRGRRRANAGRAPAKPGPGRFRSLVARLGRRTRLVGVPLDLYRRARYGVAGRSASRD